MKPYGQHRKDLAKEPGYSFAEKYGSIFVAKTVEVQKFYKRIKNWDYFTDREQRSDAYHIAKFWVRARL